MGNYQIRAIVKHENIVTFHVEADSLEAAKAIVQADYENGTEKATFISRSEIDDSSEFAEFDDRTCISLDEQDAEDNDFDDEDEECECGRLMRDCADGCWGVGYHCDIDDYEDAGCPDTFEEFEAFQNNTEGDDDE